MTNRKKVSKAIFLSMAAVSSVAVVSYANNAPKTAKIDENTVNLNVEKINKDTVRISVDNIKDSIKSLQLSTTIDGNVKFDENNIKWLISNREGLSEDIQKNIKLSEDKKNLELFIVSNEEIKKQGSKIDILEIKLTENQARLFKSSSSYKILPNTYKYIISNTNKLIESDNIVNSVDKSLSINTAPTISLNGELENVNTTSSTITIKEGDKFNELKNSFVVVNDEDNDDLTITVEGEVNTSQVGSYPVVYTVTDSAGESASIEVVVLVELEKITTPPTINGVVDRKEIYAGQMFNPMEGISAVDAKNKKLEVILSGEFDLNTEGTYELTYTANDRYGNTSEKKTTLVVKEDEAPIITGADDKVIKIQDTPFDKLEGVNVTDKEDADLGVKDLKITGEVKNKVAGTYNLLYSVTDSVGNTTRKQRSIRVNQAPAINGDLSYIIVKKGTEVSDERIKQGITVTDDVDMDLNLRVDRQNLNTNTEGNYEVSLISTDSDGETSTVIRTIVVSNDSIVDIPGSGNGLTEDNPIKKEVINEDVIKTISSTLSDLTKTYDVKMTKTSVLEDYVYNIEVSTKNIAFMNDSKSWFVEIKVPKSIDDSTGGIIITPYTSIKVSSIVLDKLTINQDELKKGDKIVVNAKINPNDAENKELLWTVTDSSVIKITPNQDTSSAQIEALKSGYATVRVSATDGSGQFAEVVVNVGEQPSKDTQAPKFEYSGKTEITLANGMNYDVPNINANDNVDTGLSVIREITDRDGNKLDRIDTNIAGSYKIKYTTKDNAGNKAELVLNITVKEPIQHVNVSDGDATKESPLKINVDTSNGLNTFLEEIKNDSYEPKVVGNPIKVGDKITYNIKITKKKGFIAKLFNRAVKDVYYINITVEDKSEFTSILNSLPKENIGGGSTGGGSTPPSVPQTAVTQLIGEDRYQTAAKISKEAFNNANTVIIVNGNNNHLVDGLTATPLASAKNAPILLSNNKELPKFTIDEIKRLNPSNVIVIGGETSMPNSIINEVKNINSNIKVSRIGGQTRYETSLNIAKELDKINNITKIYVGAGYGEADSLSISPVAGREKAPIILTEKDGLDKATYDYIKSQNVVDGYVIGGDARISDKALKQIDDVVSKDISGNRISGAERQDTNAKIIEKFYTTTDLQGVVVTKDYDLVDALSVGPLAAKNNMPVVLATNTLSKSQENILTKKKSSKIYETGGGIKSSVVDKIKSLVSK